MKIKTKDMVMTALMTAVICILAPVSIPVGPVPISLATLAILIAVYVLGMKRAYRTCGRTGIFRVFGGTGKACRAYGRLSYRIYSDGRHSGTYCGQVL